MGHPTAGSPAWPRGNDPSGRRGGGRSGESPFSDSPRLTRRAHCAALHAGRPGRTTPRLAPRLRKLYRRRYNRRFGNLGRSPKARRFRLPGPLTPGSAAELRGAGPPQRHLAAVSPGAPPPPAPPHGSTAARRRAGPSESRAGIPSARPHLRAEREREPRGAGRRCGTRGCSATAPGLRRSRLPPSSASRCTRGATGIGAATATAAPRGAAILSARHRSLPAAGRRVSEPCFQTAF